MAKSEIVLKAEEFTAANMSANSDKGIFYHNFEHTKEVVSAAKLIASKEGVDDSDIEIIELAALFHDIAYKDAPFDHEEKSAEIAVQFLKNNSYNVEKTEQVKECILATKIPQNPKNICERIVCDADLFHLGKNSYSERVELLRLELEQRDNKTISDAEWLENNINFLNNHKFHTAYARENLTKKKNNNLIDLQKKLRKKKKREAEDELKYKVQNVKLESETAKNEKPGRGIETMFRIIFSNHMRLSSMADNKSHIMISVNTILISIVVSFLVRNLGSHPYLVAPTLMLLTTSLLSMVFAILATKPHITQGMFTSKDIEEKRANLLFFGNFFNMEYDIFAKGLNSMMNDKGYLYGSMISDFYYLGKNLSKKYKLISICYNIFMFGMIASIIAFAVAIIITPGGEIPLTKK